MSGDPTAVTGPAQPADGWQRDPLGLDAYLGRVGVRRPLRADPETLRTLHRAHVAAIPFENLDIPLGRGVSVDLADVQAKLVRRERGGYCFEHGLLFAAVLDQLGFRVTRLLTRTGDPAERPHPRAHLVLRVRLGDTDWLADTGFGSGLLEPVPLTEADLPAQGSWRYRCRRGADTAWRLQAWRQDRWETLYTIAEEATYPVDVDGANHVTATSPGSPFVRQPVVVRLDDDRIRRLIGRQYTVERPDAPTEERTVTDEDLGEVLTDLGVHLSPADLAALLALR
ncbi:arylamine N-acetyltransferase [Micromonospora sp. NPDC000089]|uniref:arylamine N-acetyltransferase family protein n=1 Tax=unclassified Micromonospora TaxID=2617518 RepID=UPI0036A39C84